MGKNKILGIDLGTTNSCIAIWQHGEAHIIPNAEGGRLTPSIVAFRNNDEVLVGEPARNHALLHPSETITSVKKLMGKTFAEVSAWAEMCPYEITGTDGGYPAVKVRGRSYTPQEVSAFILQKLKWDAESYLGEEISDVIITVPAKFGVSEIKATREAAAIAGLNVRRIIPEPTSACLSLGMKEGSTSGVAIFDLGGGSLDVSILELGEGVFEVLSTFGDLSLGGNDFDLVIVDWLMEQFKSQYGFDLVKDPMVVYRFREAAEKAKIKLSRSESADIHIPFIAVGGKIRDLSINITRAIFRHLSSSLIKRCETVCRETISRIGDRGVVIDNLVFVGGATRMPFIQESISSIFNSSVNRQINPDEIVASGAAVQGAVLTGDVKDVLLLDLTCYDYCIRGLDKGKETYLMIPKCSTIPSKYRKAFLSRHVKGFAGEIALENAKARAAIREEYYKKKLERQASGEEKGEREIGSPGYSLFLEELMALERIIDVEEEILPPKSAEPGGKQRFELEIVEKDDLHEVVVQRLVLQDVPYNRHRPNQVQVIFDIDANAILHVTMRDKDSGIETTGRMEFLSGLPKTRLAEAIDSFRHREHQRLLLKQQEDAMRKGREYMVQSRQQLLEFDTHISAENKDEIMLRLRYLDESVQHRDVDKINSEIDLLNSSWQLATQQMYLDKQDNISNSTEGVMEEKKIQIFISYAHVDEAYKKRLIASLSPLKRLGLIDIWNDREIIPGTLWEQDGIYRNLEQADIIILMISSDFINSDYCFDKEIRKARERQLLNEVSVIPVVIRPTHWKKLDIARLQALPRDGKPVSTWANEDEAWQNIVEGVEKVVYDIRGKRGAHHPLK
jgi:molecular chaperone DnaK (HSP70)